MENDDIAEPSAAQRSTAPSLPPRPAGEGVDDVWVGVEPEPEHLHHVDHHDHDAHRQRFLLPTWMPRAMAAVGWLGGSVATIVLIATLMPRFRLHETDNYRVTNFDDARTLAAVLIAAGLLVYVGWAWWSISAAYNASRVIALATSPWLPMLVYVGGPVALLAGADREGPVSTALLVGGGTWIAIGHLWVVASLRTTAGRVRASTDEFSKLFWLPLAWVTFHIFANTMLTFVDDRWRSSWLLAGVGALGALFPLALATATWHATGMFDSSCRRQNTRSLGPELATTEMITAAIRQRALEGR